MKITSKKYAQALVQVMSASKGAPNAVRNLLALLRQRKQFKLLPKILQAFEQEWNRLHNIVKMEISYPEKFAESAKDLERGIAAKLGKKTDTAMKPSKSMIGGFRVRVEDTLIDSSLETSLRALGEKLIA